MPERLATAAGLTQAWQPKLLVAGIGAVLLEALVKVGEIYGHLFATDPALVVLCMTLLFIDLVTGVISARKRGEKLTSKALRRTGYKVLEYTALSACAIIISNAFKDYWPHLLTDGLDDATLLYVAATELLSVVENVTGSRAKALHLIRQIVRIREDGPAGLVTLEEIVTQRPATPAEVAAALPTSSPDPFAEVVPDLIIPPIPDEVVRKAAKAAERKSR